MNRIQVSHADGLSLDTCPAAGFEVQELQKRSIENKVLAGFMLVLIGISQSD